MTVRRDRDSYLDSSTTLEEALEKVAEDRGESVHGS